MRILCDATVLDHPKTGVANALIHLYAACLKISPQIEMEALHRGNLQCELPDGMVDHGWGSMIPLDYWRSIVIPWRALRFRPDFLHFHNNHSIPRLFTKAIVVNTIHDALPMRLPASMLPEGYIERYRYRIQRDLNRTDLLLTISEFSRNDILHYFKPRSEPTVIPLASTLTNQVPERVLQLDGLDGYFLYVGGYSPRKGLAQLLQVFLELTRQRKISKKLVLTGNPVRFSTEFARLLNQGLEMGAILELGYVTDGQLRQAYMQALALVYPSKYEGFGLPPLEAMSLGCPVVTTRETSLPEICGNAAIYIDPDGSSFGEALVSIENDQVLRKNLIEKGLSQASKFSWEKSAMLFISHLEEARKLRQAAGRNG